MCKYVCVCGGGGGGGGRGMGSVSHDFIPVIIYLAVFHCMCTF